MAYTITLQSASGVLAVDVAPYHGGMVTQIRLSDLELLHLDSSMLETAPMAAGGMPLLFPFASKTRNDRYLLNGTEYYMPMHGLLKNASFAVKSSKQDSVVLWAQNNPTWLQQNYPFCFDLELHYRVHDASLFTTIRVTNRSARPMPHYLGWHPFFFSCDKKNMTLRHQMSMVYDYVQHVDRPAQDYLDLGSYLDDVFHTPRGNGFELLSPTDGYAVRCVPDTSFQSLVVCSWVNQSMCVEPWCGIPDAINCGRFVIWVPPETTQQYDVEWQFRLL